MGVDERDPLRFSWEFPTAQKEPEGYSSQLRDGIDMCVPDFDAPD